MLHLIFQSPIDTAILERMDSSDVVVFLENAVLRIYQHSNISDALTKQLSRNRLCVLSDDIAVRGITADELVKGIEAITYAELVELTITNPIIQSWT
ncbi:MAG: sulfurtransferase complex subunit TusB [Methylobacter sp.]|nr:sulfurtransferase complex subunit TusB [Methylobacter sp.]